MSQRIPPKALIMFFAGTTGIVLGGPAALLIVGWLFPSWLGADASEVWRGLATVAGSWIGGGANQAAMKEIFSVQDSLFSTMVAVDVMVSQIWLAFLLFGAGINKKIDIQNTQIEKVMTKTFKTIGSDALAVDAAEIMENNKILTLVVMNKNKYVGVVSMHDLIEARIL